MTKHIFKLLKIEFTFMKLEEKRKYYANSFFVVFLCVDLFLFHIFTLVTSQFWKKSMCVMKNKIRKQNEYLHGHWVRL